VPPVAPAPPKRERAVEYDDNGRIARVVEQ
jgi:hypothetical protein